MGAAIIILVICLSFAAILFFIGLIVFFVLLGNKSSDQKTPEDGDDSGNDKSRSFNSKYKKQPTRRVTVIEPSFQPEKVIEEKPVEEVKPSYVITYSELDDTLLCGRKRFARAEGAADFDGRVRARGDDDDYVQAKILRGAG